jgi:nudix-type nucleoside diphosphatase (YffH/AdpP family)
MRAPRRIEIRKQTRLFDDFFKIDEVIVSHEQYNGTMSADQRRLIFERGDSVAVLLYNPNTNAVVMVNQFKVPSLAARRRDNPATTDGWITEAIAGMIDQNETPEEAIIRETMEETGYKIHDPTPICKFFSSPGGTSERIFLYFAQVSEADRIGEGGGLAGEDIRVVKMRANELFDQLANRQIEDPKLAIAAYWLKDHLRHVKPLKFSTVRYEIKEKPGLIVGYKTGSIENINGVSIWVNSENTDMMMDRFLGKTISARIRFLGAIKDQDDNVVEDIISEELRGAVGERGHVKIGTVLVTESGMLCGRNQVKRIFHVATVEGGPGEGVSAKPDKLEECVARVLRRADEENNRLWRILRKKNLDSILFPMLGAGDGGLPIEAVAADIIPVAIRYFCTNPNATLKEIYFLAFTSRDKSACDAVLEEFCTQGILASCGAPK